MLLRILDRMMYSPPMRAFFATSYGQVAEDIYRAFRFGGFRYGVVFGRMTVRRWPQRHMTVVCIRGDHQLCIAHGCKCKVCH